jgi:N-acetylmuramoyl-L-alanine amidase
MRPPASKHVPIDLPPSEHDAKPALGRARAVVAPIACVRCGAVWAQRLLAKRLRLRSLGLRGERLPGLTSRWVHGMLVACALLVVLAPSPAWVHAAEEERAPADAPATITKVQRYAAEDAARIVLHVSKAVSFRKGELGGGGALDPLVVDVGGVGYGGPHAYEMGGLVQRVRLLPVGSAYRVVLDTTAAARHTAFYLPEPFRIVIDVSRRDERAPAPSRGRQVARIALDPGHGGTDPGAIGGLGTQEKDVVLDIAHRAAPLLARELGISTLLTRDTDVRVPLEERVARANAFGADLFISIHCNAERTGSARGVMTFILDGSHQHGVLGLLAHENATASPDAAELSRFAEQFADAAAAERSTTFARLLQRSSLASLAAGYPQSIDGGVHGAGFYVLAGATMPAVLFETSFVSNALEERRLGSPRYRQKLADAIVNAVRAYREGYPAAPRPRRPSPR